MRAFSEAADGIRTHDLLHGKQLLPLASHPENACKSTGICAAHIEIGFAANSQSSAFGPASALTYGPTRRP